MTDCSFMRAFRETLRQALFSRDTFAVFVGAVAFYLIFYAWPYGNQQLEHIPVIVADLDGSAASRRLTSEIDASPAMDLRAVLRDEAEALDAMRRDVVHVVITIPKRYEKDLARTDNTEIHVVGNGAFPVKARAVQAALAGIVTDKARLADTPAVFASGLPVTAISAQEAVPPAIRTQYRFNEIGGYGSYTVPVVGPVIIQAVMLMGITMSLGGLLCAPRRENFIRAALRFPVRIGSGIFWAYWLIAVLWYVYMQCVDFRIFEYGSVLNLWGTMAAGALFCASVTALGLFLTMLFGSNRWTTQAVVMISAPAVFLSGAIWPVESFSSPLIFALSNLLPSTPGVQAILAASQDGAATTDLMLSLGILTVQTAFYLFLAAWFAGRRLETEPPAFADADMH